MKARHESDADVRDELRSVVREASSDDAHFYGAWRRGGSVSGGTMAKAKATQRRAARERQSAKALPGGRVPDAAVKAIDFAGASSAARQANIERVSATPKGYGGLVAKAVEERKANAILAGKSPSVVDRFVASKGKDVEFEAYNMQTPSTVDGFRVVTHMTGRGQVERVERAGTGWTAVVKTGDSALILRSQDVAKWDFTSPADRAAHAKAQSDAATAARFKQPSPDLIYGGRVPLARVK